MGGDKTKKQKSKVKKKKGNIRVRAGAKAASCIISPDHLNHISPHFVSLLWVDWCHNSKGEKIINKHGFIRQLVRVTDTRA